MVENNKIGLVYGYAVCLVAVITFLISSRRAPSSTPSST